MISVAPECARGQGHKQPSSWAFPPQMERRLRRAEGAPVTLHGVLHILYGEWHPLELCREGEVRTDPGEPRRGS